MQGTLIEEAMASRHQGPPRRAGAGVGLETCPGMRKTMEDRHQGPPRGAGVGLESCPGMRKTMEDMHQDQEVLEVAVKGT